MARQLLVSVCGDDVARWREAEPAALRYPRDFL
jgi:hypothetical protein